MKLDAALKTQLSVSLDAHWDGMYLDQINVKGLDTIHLVCGRDYFLLA